MLKRGATIGSVAGGLVAATDLQTTYQGAGLKVEIAAGEAIVPNNVSASGTGYYLRLSATSTVTLPAANSSNARVEAVAAYIKDESYSGSGNEGLVEVLAGNAKAGATLGNLEGAPGQSGGPALPKNVLVLAYILVPAAATTISNADIKNVAERANLGLSAGLNMVDTSSGREILNGEFTEVSAAVTMTVTPSVNLYCGAINRSGGTVTIKANSGSIYGDFLNGVSEFKLATNQHVLLLSEGANLYIIAGEPKREFNEVASGRTIGEAHEPSATRPTFVTGYVTVAAGKTAEVKVGEERLWGKLANNSAIEETFTVGFWIGAGETYKITEATLAWLTYQIW